MINVVNPPADHNPRWPGGNVAETTKLLAVGPAHLAAPRRRLLRRPGMPGWHARRLPGWHPRRLPGWHPRRLPGWHVLRAARAAVSGWLASLPHRAGVYLFTANDEEARWRGWEITELRAGLARGYRDHRFDAFRELAGLEEELAAQLGADLQDTDPADPQPQAGTTGDEAERNGDERDEAERDGDERDDSERHGCQP